MTVTKLISNGQTGADRVPLDLAIFRDVPHGEWFAALKRLQGSLLTLREKYLRGQ
jgi:hypothetical protein